MRQMAAAIVFSVTSALCMPSGKSFDRRRVPWDFGGCPATVLASWLDRCTNAQTVHLLAVATMLLFNVETS